MRKTNGKTRENTAFLYERLSRDDNLEGDSYSIQNQKKLLTKVAKEKGYTHLVHFFDDGISGVTMNRPGFKDMIVQLELGRASAVFVKDLSRLGRNYIEVGRYCPVQEYPEEHKLFGKGILLNHSFSTKQRGSIANRFHRMLSGICPDCGCSRVFSFSHYTTPTKR